MVSIRPNLRNRIINDPSGVKAELKKEGIKVGIKSMPSDAQISTPTPTIKPEQIQETDEAPHTPLSQPIALKFIFSMGDNLGKVLPIADLGEAGPTQCDKCKLKDAEGGRVEGRG